MAKKGSGILSQNQYLIFTVNYFTERAAKLPLKRCGVLLLLLPLSFSTQRLSNMQSDTFRMYTAHQHVLATRALKQMCFPQHLEAPKLVGNSGIYRLLEKKNETKKTTHPLHAKWNPNGQIYYNSGLMDEIWQNAGCDSQQRVNVGFKAESWLSSPPGISAENNGRLIRLKATLWPTL